MSKFAVTLNYYCDYGYVEYDSENKKVEVVLSDAEAKASVEKFLSENAYAGRAGRRHRAPVRHKNPGPAGELGQL